MLTETSNRAEVCVKDTTGAIRGCIDATEHRCMRLESLITYPPQPISLRTANQGRRH